MGGGSVELDVGGREVSDSRSDAGWRWGWWGSIVDITSSSSSSSSSFSSEAEEAEASSAMNDGRLDFVFGGADLRRGAEALVDLETEVDFEAAAGRGGLKVGGLRFGAGLDVVGGICCNVEM